MKKFNCKTMGLAILLVGLVSAGCSNSGANNKPPEDQGIPVNTVKLQKEKVSIPIHVSGNISSSKESRLSFKTGGIIEKVFVDEGDKVKKGQVLAKLDLKEIMEQVNQAKVGLAKASRDFERVQSLFADTVATLEQLQNAKSALDIANANLNIASYNLKYSSIAAPADGVILKKFFEEDEIVGTGMPIFYFASAEEAWNLTIGLSDKDIVKIKIGDKAVIETDAYPGKNIDCTVSKIANASGEYTGLYEIELTVNNIDLKLKHGFFAKGAVVPSNENECFSIPISAVQEGIGNQVVFYTVSDDQRLAIKQEVNIISITKDKVFFYSDILKEDMLIVVENQKELKHLDKLKVIDTKIMASVN